MYKFRRACNGLDSKVSELYALVLCEGFSDPSLEFRAPGTMTQKDPMRFRNAGSKDKSSNALSRGMYALKGPTLGLRHVRLLRAFGSYVTSALPGQGFVFPDIASRPLVSEL